MMIILLLVLIIIFLIGKWLLEASASLIAMAAVIVGYVIYAIYKAKHPA